MNWIGIYTANVIESASNLYYTNARVLAGLVGQNVDINDLLVRGDLIVHIEVTTPGKLNKEQEELLKSLAKSRGEKGEDVEIHRRSVAHSAGFFGRFRDAFNR